MASDRVRIGIFYAFLKNALEMMYGTSIQIRFYKKKMTPLMRFIHLIMQEYDYQCHKMYLITFKVFNIFCADHQSQ
jgi:hypothetical protein